MLKMYELDMGETTYNLSSLSEFFRQNYALGIRGIEECYLQFTNSSELSSEARLVERLDDIDKKPANLHLGEYEKIIKKVKSNHEQIQRDKNRKKLAETLTEKIQEGFLKHSYNLLDDYSKAQVEIAVEKWQSYRRWSFQFDEVLDNLVLFLTGLKTHLNHALKELDKAYSKRFTLNRISKPFYMGYRKYLTEQLKIVHKEAKAVSESALARLELAGCNESSHEGDLVAHMAKQLANLRIIPKSTGEKVMLKRQFSSLKFNNLHQVVLKFGTKLQKIRLSKLPWFQSFATHSNKIDEIFGDKIFCFNKSFAQQFGVSDLVPASPRWPNWLFRNYNLRANFFNNITPFAQIALNTQSLNNNAQTSDMDLSNLKHFVLDVKEANTGFEQFYKAINQAESKINKGLRKYFSNTTRKFLSTLSKSLKAKEVATQKNIVIYLNRLIESLKVDELKPSEALLAEIMKIQRGFLSNNTTVSMTLNVFMKEFYQADKRVKEQTKKRKLKEKYDAIINSFEEHLTATLDKPSSLNSLQWLLNNIQNTKDSDLYPINFKLRVLYPLKIVVYTLPQRAPNFGQYLIKKPFYFIQELFGTFKKAIISNIFIHNLPQPLNGV